MNGFLRLVVDIFTSPIQIGEISFSFSLWRVLLEMILPLIIVLVVSRLVRLTTRRLLVRFKAQEETVKRTLKWIRLVFRLIFLLILVLTSLRLFESDVPRYLIAITGVLNQPLIPNTSISLVTLLLMVPVFYLANWASKRFKVFLEKRVLPGLKISDSQKFTVANLSGYVGMTVVLLVGLSVIGIDLSALAVIFGVLGIGLGFGLQSVVGNLFAGIVVILARPIKEGDRIQMGEIEGTVVRIRALHTVVNTLTAETIILPNRQIVDEPVHNYSHEDPKIMVRNEVQVAYSSDIELVLSTMEEIGTRNPYAVPGRPVSVRVKATADSGVDVFMLTWIRNADDKYAALSWNYVQILKGFKEAGIEIPFPHRVLMGPSAGAVQGTTPLKIDDGGSE